MNTKESWTKKEILEIAEEVKKIDKAIESGEYKKWDTLGDVMDRYGYVLTGKNKDRIKKKSS